jgi:nucleoside-diphosphate-sugar epimerase
LKALTGSEVVTGSQVVTGSELVTGSDVVTGLEVVAGDLTEPASLAAACAGVTAIVHAASYVGPDEQLCTAVNDAGTGHLLHAARRAGVARVVAVSTTGVYGDATTDGSGRPVDTPGLVTAPVTAVSRSRLRAERRVLAAGGVVVRPHLVVGVGDRWVVPGIVRLVTAVGGLPDGGTAPLSAIGVDDLAALLVAVALQPAWRPGGVHHATHPVPATLAGFVAVIRTAVGVELPTGPVPAPTAVRRAGTHARQVYYLARPHHYDGGRLWRATGLPVPPDPLTRLREAAPWYSAARAQS